MTFLFLPLCVTFALERKIDDYQACAMGYTLEIVGESPWGKLPTLGGKPEVER
jgi:hypothetical protein